MISGPPGDLGGSGDDASARVHACALFLCSGWRGWGWKGWNSCSVLD